MAICQYCGNPGERCGLEARETFAGWKHAPRWGNGASGVAWKAMPGQEWERGGRPGSLGRAGVVGIAIGGGWGIGGGPAAG